MPDKTGWEARAQAILKAEIKRKGFTYARVVERLNEMGLKEDERNFRNKLARGKFSAAFLLACLQAIDTETLHLS